MRKFRLASVFVSAIAVLISAAGWADDDSRSGKQPPEATDPPIPQLVGIGTALKPVEEGFEVAHLLPNAPAALSGEIQQGDVIVAVAEANGTPNTVDGMSLEQIVALIRGPAGTNVELTIVPRDNRFVKRKVVSLHRQPLHGGRLIGKPVPDVPLTVVADKTAHRLSDFRGKVVVLEFWSTTCVPCIRHIESLQREFNAHPEWEDSAAFITFNVDEDLEQVREFVRNAGWTMPINVWGDENVTKAFAPFVLPMAIVIDPKGKVVAAGHPQGMNISKLVNTLLEQ